MGRDERSVRRVLGIVIPEGVDLHQVRVLLFDRQLVVVVLDPFLGLVELLVEPRGTVSADGRIGIEAVTTGTADHRAASARSAVPSGHSYAVRECRVPTILPSASFLAASPWAFSAGARRAVPPASSANAIPYVDVQLDAAASSVCAIARLSVSVSRRGTDPRCEDRLAGE